MEEAQTTVINLLKDIILVKTKLPNPKLYYKVVKGTLMIRLVIDRTTNHQAYITWFAKLANDIYMAYIVDVDMLILQKSEVKQKFVKELGYTRLRL